jgi:hypothetical protein
LPATRHKVKFCGDGRRYDWMVAARVVLPLAGRSGRDCWGAQPTVSRDGDGQCRQGDGGGEDIEDLSFAAGGGGRHEASRVTVALCVAWDNPAIRTLAPLALYSQPVSEPSGHQGQQQEASQG